MIFEKRILATFAKNNLYSSLHVGKAGELDEWIWNLGLNIDVS